MKTIEYKHLNYFLIGFFVLQALPFLSMLAHPLYFFWSSMIVLPASLAAVVVLLLKGDAMMRRLKYQVTLLLYVLATLFYAYAWHAWSASGVLE